MSRKKSPAQKPNQVSKHKGKAPSDEPTGKAEQKNLDESSAKPQAPPGGAAMHEEPQQTREITFPVVGIGASAGGLEAFTQLFEHLPEDTGMAFVLVQHLAPTHESMLTELLSRVTDMLVSEVKDGMKVKPNHVYVIPPNTNMAILHGVLHLMPRSATHGQHMPIDYFLRSLAEDQKSRAVGVILSGTASDGAMGLKAVKAEGGITFAQDERTAKYDGMPRSAIAAGFVDFILPPEKIAQELAGIGRHPYISQAKPEKTDVLLPETGDELNKILILLRSHTGVDFSYYKLSTIKRRIVRRMVLHKIEDLSIYTKFLQTNLKEVEALYNDILINVTGFFRDPETFAALVEKLFPAIMQHRTADQPVRIWVPGCSTGEEAYSIAICLLEYLAEKTTSTSIQIFATDISDMAIEKARAGIYLENISADVSPDRLRRFFVKLEHGYQISKTIRDICIFAKQNVTKDPPFSKLDLISCRNVLIYLGPILQKNVMPIFHYALNSSGFLLLGSSETIGGFSDLFGLVDKKNKIYSKKMTLLRPPVDFATSEYHAEIGQAHLAKKVGEKEWGGFNVQSEADHILLNKYAPAGVIINEDVEILQFRGRTGPYLEPTPGEASLNLFSMTREGLAFDLRTAIHKAKKNNAAIRKDGVEVKYGNQALTVNIEVIPIQGPTSKERYFLVLFEATSVAGERKKSQKSEATAKKARQRLENAQVVQLKKELQTTKEYMQSIIEEQEATNEEMRSANEEIQSSNEELQSTNEELETAKEELQSTNEELTTVNEELENRNQELTQLNNDLSNFLSSVNLPIVMLGSDLRIRHFTPKAEKVLNLIPTDTGRRLSDIKPNIDVPDLEHLIDEVISSLSTKEREVQDHEGRWYSMRIRPYRTTDNRIDGVILILLDMDVQKSNDFYLAVLETVREPLLVLDKDLRIAQANRAFFKTFEASPMETHGKLIYELGNRQWDIPKLRELLENILPNSTFFENFEVEHEFPTIGRRIMLLNAREIRGKKPEPEMILLTIDDITARKLAEQELQKSRGKYKSLVDSLQQMVWIMEPDGQTDYCNRHWYEYTGLTEAQMSDGGWRSALHPEDVQTARERLQRAAEAGEGFDLEYRIKRGDDGAYRWHRAHITPVRGDGGQIIKWMGAAIDIDDHKRAEEESR